MKHLPLPVAGLLIFTVPSAALGQSLLKAESAPPPSREIGPDGKPVEADPQEPLRTTSLTLVEAPKPRDYQVHDLITIIVQEQSRQSSSAKLDTKKDAALRGRISSLPDLTDLLELSLDTSDTNPQVEVGASGNTNFKGDGKYERTERMTDRITATVIDVKPNGTIVIEARRTITKDNQTQTVVLSGMCRREDITTANTILSSQLAELVLRVESEGDVSDTAEKGFFTRLFEAVFNF